MQKITPCLWFDTQGEEAARYYVSLFPSSAIRSVAYWGPENPERQGEVLTVEFVLDGRPFTALNGGPQFRFTEAISLQIDCADQAEVDRFWDRFIGDGGEESMCGWLKDKYGLSWQIVPRGMEELFADPDPSRAQRAVQAMMQMRKLDVAALHAAADEVPVS